VLTQREVSSKFRELFEMEPNALKDEDKEGAGL
jgi:hypothetical protein